MPWIDPDTYEPPRPIGLALSWLLLAGLPAAVVAVALRIIGSIAGL